MRIEKTKLEGGERWDFIYSDKDYDEFDRVNAALGSDYKIMRPAEPTPNKE